MQQHVFLLGFPGTGTITIGKQLAERLKLPFREMNRSLTQETQSDLLSLYQTLPPEEYAQRQRTALQKLANDPPAVIAVEDNAPLQEEDWEILACGITVYIQRPAERLFWRLHSDRKIPILQAFEGDARKVKIERELAEREPCYLRAHLAIPCLHEEVPDIAGKITEKLDPSSGPSLSVKQAYFDKTHSL